MTRRARRQRFPALRAVFGAMLLGVISSGCVPVAAIPAVPVSIPDQVDTADAGAHLARQLAPLLYLQRDEKFRLERVVAVLHPSEPVIAYHLLWEDDAHGSWAPFTRPTDQEIVWVGYDESGAATDLWTYWHGTVLHAEWKDRGQVIADVQWGKHGTLPHRVDESDLPAVQGLTTFYLLSWALPDLWLGRLVRDGPWCFCNGPRRYRDFSEPVFLGHRLTATVRTENPDPALSAVFGKDYSRKPPWPESRGVRDAGRATRDPKIAAGPSPD